MYGKITKTKESKTAKGVKKSVIRKEIKHQHYLDYLFNNQIMKNKMNTTRSECHQVSSYQMNNTSLSCYDDKRYILDDGISSLAYGHYKIDKNRQTIYKYMEKRKPKYIQIRKYNEDGTDEIEFVYIVDDFANRSLEKNDYETYKNLKSK